ncbi:tol-pal system protein YbgF [Thiomicrorhabdus lithotrophica]|uniref:Cell division coordinator CpoB n=1 Tax=Thiomicrorhabdus lithotrophica TaxID=2949997 RepID=A0ABY8C6Y4_9GAMM|nr:tol-pal system protein YbgF [Thiomicrorhabdus lithotrophica]WEJ61733.1 tol-pal system protein YbgF [Thiomicrorhabdus lithotrophica]
MRKTFLIAAVSALSLSIALPANAAQGSALEQRVKRLERMLENPVLLQLSRRLGEQQRDIQTLQDENDRLKRDLNKLRALMDKRYKESDERFSLLEGGKTNTGSTTKVPPVIAPVTASPSIETQANTAVKTEAISVVSDKVIVPVAKVEEDKAKQSAVSPKAEQVAAQESAEQMKQDQQAAKADVIEAKPGPIKTYPATDEEKEQYKAAFALMRASKYDASIKGFLNFLESHPKSDLASNAAYWSGEGYLIKEQNQAALDSFMLVIERYPDSSKVPDAKLRAGDTHERLGNLAEAKSLYKDLINTRPHSRAAKNAQKRLEKL